MLRSDLIGLKDLIEQAESLYGVAFSAKLFLQQLTYTRDLADMTNALTLLTEPEAFENVAAELRKAVAAYVMADVASQNSSL